MNKYEIIERLRKGAHIIAAFGSVTLRVADEKPVTVRKNLFTHLTKNKLIIESSCGVGWSQYIFKHKKCQHKNWSRVGSSEEIAGCFDCGASVRDMLYDGSAFRATVAECIQAMDKHPESKIFSEFLKSRLFDN
jgi:hypothetical protein